MPAPGAAYPGPPAPNPWGPRTPQPGLPGMLGAAHKPGVMPLRPLGLGDIFDAAFKTIRANPAATVGSAVLVATAAMSVPVIVTALLGYAFDVTMTSAADPTSVPSDSSAGVFLTAMAPFAALMAGGLLTNLGLLLVTGMVAHVTHAAATGRRMTLGQAWAATHGKRWRLLGLTVVLALMLAVLVAAWVGSFFLLALADAPSGAVAAYGFLSFFGFVALVFWFWIRVYYLAVPVLMLEPVGVFGAIGRGYRLTARQFWRTFGIGLLTWFITVVAGYVTGIPLGIVAGLIGAELGPTDALLALTIAQALSTVAATAFTGPFTAAVTSLQYLDQRMRKESYDVELMAQAGLTGQ